MPTVEDMCANALLAIATAVGVVATAGFALTFAPPVAADKAYEDEPGPDNHDDPARHPHLGIWVTADGYIRHELLPNGRYDEQRGGRKHAYQGRYWVKGNRIFYGDDTGFTADGEFRGGKFYHAGYVFTRP
jgi:hypothetical protein